MSVADDQVVLHDLRDERRRRRAERKEQFSEARKPRTPLEELIQAVATKSEAKAKIDLPTLERLDAILRAAEQLAFDWPKDTKRIADGLLRAMLRLAWVRCSGRPLSDPEPDRIAMKLFQANAIDKVTSRRITVALKRTENPVHILDVCRGLLVMISS